MSEEIKPKRKRARVSRPNSGRKPFGEVAMSKSEVYQRFNENLKKSGGRAVTVRLRDGDLVDVMDKLKKLKGFKSDTATATWLLEEALRKIAQSVNDKSAN